MAEMNVLATMAERFHLEPEQFKRVVKATCGLEKARDEEFYAFLVVAHQYGFNPLTREIYAFVKPSGGIQSIVGVDGWYKKANEHPAFNGIEFEDVVQGGQLIAVTAKVFRKDRSHPTMVTEYLSECRRNTDPWRQWPARMLRHKAAIQAIRIAFNLAGIMDPDEAERYEEMLIKNPESVAPIEPTIDQDMPGEKAGPKKAPRPARAAEVVDVERSTPPPIGGGRKKAAAIAAPPPPPLKAEEPPPPTDEPISADTQNDLIDKTNAAGLKPTWLFDHIQEKYGVGALKHLKQSQANEIEQYLRTLDQ